MKPPYSDERIRECPLVRWSGDPTRCRWCDAPLVGRQRRWCSECPDAYSREHSWGSARMAALRRDGWRCVRCGIKPSDAIEVSYLLGGLLALVGADRYAARRARDAWESHHRLEVNHRVPILGRHAEVGCHHHLDGLETLCHPCHVAETNRQFGRAPALGDSLFGGAA